MIDAPSGILEDNPDSSKNCSEVNSIVTIIFFPSIEYVAKSLAVETKTSNVFRLGLTSVEFSFVPSFGINKSITFLMLCYTLNIKRL